MFAVRLLGRPSIFDGKSWIFPPKGKAAALLIYLAYQNNWVGRDELTYLFWPDKSDKQAQSNLRTLLTRFVKPLPYASNLEIERSSLRWQVKSDVQDFKNQLELGNLDVAVDKYKNNLLEHFSVTNTPEFDHWLELERLELYNLFQDAAQKLAAYYEKEADLNALTTLRYQLHQRNPLEEGILQVYLQSLITLGDFNKAKQSYEHFEERLWAELGLKPDPITKALSVEISKALERQGHFSSNQVFEVNNDVIPNISSRLQKVVKDAPTNLSPFIGRKKEIDIVREKLQDCRLVSIVAPGGMGKTRLALEVAESLLEAFSDDVYFCSLVELTKKSQIVFALAKTLNLSLQTNMDANEQLINYLKQKNTLLVLDNYEHLNDGKFLALLLTHCKNIKILLTSRQVVGLRQEFVYELDGLGHLSKNIKTLEKTLDLVKTTEKNKTLEYEAENDAIELFVSFTKQYITNFSLTDETIREITEICQRLGGMPLAIELAATWLRHLSLTELHDELKTGFDVLMANEADVPTRHQSIEAIFEQSWLRLRTVEKDVLLKLAVFESSFTKHAAQEIGQANIPIIATLRNKVFLKFSSGRYFFHPLLHEFLKSKLNNNQDELQLLLESYLAYYLDPMKEYHTGQKSVFEFDGWLREERFNVQKAYSLFLKEAFLEHLINSTHLIYIRGFIDIKQAIKFYDDCLNQLDDNIYEQKLTKTRLQLAKIVPQSWLSYKVDIFEVQSILKTFESLQNGQGTIDSLHTLQQIHLREGNFEEALDFAQRAYDQALVLEAEGETIDLLYYRIHLEWTKHVVTNDESVASEILINLQNELTDLDPFLWHNFFTAFKLTKLKIAYQQYTQVKQILDKELAFTKEHNYPLDSEWVFSLLGYVAQIEKKYKKAYEYIDNALLIIEKNQTHIHKYLAYIVLARIAIAEKQFHKGEALIQEVVTRNWYGTKSELLHVYTVLAELKMNQGKLKEAASLISFCLDRKEITHLPREEAKRLLKKIEKLIDDKTMLCLRERTKTFDFDSVKLTFVSYSNQN